MIQVLYWCLLNNVKYKKIDVTTCFFILLEYTCTVYMLVRYQPTDYEFEKNEFQLSGIVSGYSINSINS